MPPAEVVNTTVSTVLQVSVELAGLLLVFIGFVFSKADSISSSKRADFYKNVGRGGFVPFALALICAWLCLGFLEGAWASPDIALYTFKLTLIVTGLFAFVVLFVYL